MKMSWLDRCFIPEALKTLHQTFRRYYGHPRLWADKKHTHTHTKTSVLFRVFHVWSAELATSRSYYVLKR